jgi:peroxiredoxin
MKKTTILMIVITMMISFMGVSCAQRGGADIGDKAMDFTLRDSNGADVNLNGAIKGNKAVLLVFWATWCPHCVNEVPQLKQLDAAYGNKGLKILAIDVGESAKKVQSFARQEGIDYTIMLDLENAVANQYGVTGIPSNILVDDNGVIKYKGVRPPPEELLPK